MASIREKRRIDGRVTYHVQVRVKGSPPVTKTFFGKTEARNWAADIEVAIRQGRHIGIYQAERHTLAQAIKRFIECVFQPIVDGISG